MNENPQENDRNRNQEQMPDFSGFSSMLQSAITMNELHNSLLQSGFNKPQAFDLLRQWMHSQIMAEAYLRAVREHGHHHDGDGSPGS